MYAASGSANIYDELTAPRGQFAILHNETLDTVLAPIEGALRMGQTTPDCRVRAEAPTQAIRILSFSPGVHDLPVDLETPGHRRVRLKTQTAISGKRRAFAHEVLRPESLLRKARRTNIDAAFRSLRPSRLSHVGWRKDEIHRTDQAPGNTRPFGRIATPQCAFDQTLPHAFAEDGANTVCSERLVCRCEIAAGLQKPLMECIPALRVLLPCLLYTSDAADE